VDDFSHLSQARVFLHTDYGLNDTTMFDLRKLASLNGVKSMLLLAIDGLGLEGVGTEGIADLFNIQ
jgi:hypothetical protein